MNSRLAAVDAAIHTDGRLRSLVATERAATQAWTASYAALVAASARDSQPADRTALTAEDEAFAALRGLPAPT